MNIELTNKLNNKETGIMIDYKLIFANLKTMKEIEETCQSKLNIGLDVLLKELYIDKNHTKYEISEMFGFKLGTVTNIIKKHKLIKNINKNTEGIYVKTPTQIEEETGRNFVELCKERLSEGISMTELAKELKLKSSGVISAKLANFESNKIMREADPSLFVIPNLTSEEHELFFIQGLNHFQTVDTINNLINEFNLQPTDKIVNYYFDSEEYLKEIVKETIEEYQN